MSFVSFPFFIFLPLPIAIMSAHKLLLLGMFILILLPECYAPPIDEQSSVESQQGSQISMSKSYSILKTIILGYVTHIMTIRPSSDTDQKNTLLWRLAYFVYPTMGISTAAEVIFLACKGEKMLGVDRYNKYFEEQRQEKLANEGKAGWSDFRIWIYDAWKSFQEGCAGLKASVKNFFKSNDEIIRETAVDNSRKIFALHEKLIAYDKNRENKDKWQYQISNDNDNIAYLAAILNTLEPRQRRRIRNFILNGSLYAGFDFPSIEKYNFRKRVLCTKDMTITGPGVKGSYQKVIKPYAVRYLTTRMLDQLLSIQYLDTTSYIAICVTAGQLVYTIINCIDAEGDRWAKVIMIIYTMMSVLQTTSLIVLHKQPVTYSIDFTEYIGIQEKFCYSSTDSDSETNSERAQSATIGSDHKNEEEEEDFMFEPMPEHRTFNTVQEEYETTYYRSGLLLKIIKEQKFFQYPTYDAFTKHKKWAYILSGFGGFALSLLAGIWADYRAHTTTQWIVLAWIINQLLFAPFVVIYQFAKYDKHWTTYFALCIICLIGTGGAGCVIVATVKGYAVKN
ncbi:hypothetical protein CLU79DRAFT_747488 [Phycomyces nitens]|nr:hypothetical protein CLU79DRAFT_747488 [Phycomyces nitens]